MLIGDPEVQICFKHSWSEYISLIRIPSVYFTKTYDLQVTFHESATCYGIFVCICKNYYGVCILTLVSKFYITNTSANSSSSCYDTMNFY